MEPNVQTNTSSNFKDFKVFGMPLYLFIVFALIIIGAVATKSLPGDFGGAIALMLVLGVVFFELGNRIPIWKDYFGGGAILTFLAASYLVYKGIIPAKYAKAVTTVMDEQGFLDLFIAILITGSILSVNRKLLIRALGGYIPTILAGVVGAFVLGGIVGTALGIPFKQLAMGYVLPIMGGGNGGGAVPMSQMWGSITGQDPKIWYSSAITVLTIANIVSIVAAALLNGLGKKKPSWSGDGELLRNAKDFNVGDKEKFNLTLQDGAVGLLLAVSFYALGALFGKGILPKIGGVAIHPYAYMVVFVALANAFKLIPERIKESANIVQKYMSGPLLILILAGVGIAYTDFGELVAAINISTLLVAIAVVVGAVLGTGIVGYFFGFFPIESAISAGLCMANRGGSGDLEVLGASKRMILMPYAQISSRLGGGIMLVIASIIFGMWAK